MVLKDAECQGCGYVAEHVLEGGVTEFAAKCEACGLTFKHKTICNGGCGKRYRFADWSGVDFSGQVKACRPTAETEVFDYDPSTGETSNARVIEDKHVSGRLCQDMPRFSDENREERRDRIRHRFKVKKGQRPIFMDMKGR